MQHYTTDSFWKQYTDLPIEIQKVADKAYDLLKINPYHPSLHFKKINEYYSVRVNIFYRALGIEADGNIIWFWIGNHNDYEKLIRGL